MSQPLSQGMGRKIGIEPSADTTMGREYDLPPEAQRLRKGKRAQSKPTPDVEEDATPTARRDVVALVMLLVGLVAIVAGVIAISGVFIGVIVFGAYIAVLGLLVAVL